MNRLIQFFIILLIVGCTFSKTKDVKSIDIFNKILLVKESQNLADLETYFGKPKTIELSTGDIAFDAYAYLKKRFKDYKWIETELPIRTDLDYAEEIHRVEIPELGITFEYDNQDPLRRPLSIFFK